MMVTLTRVSGITEADLISSLLNAHGIRVQVHEDDLAKARDVWKAYHRIEEP